MLYCNHSCILNVPSYGLLLIPTLGCTIAQSAGAVEYTYYNECPRYDTKLQSDGEIPVMLEFWGIWSTPSLPSLQDPVWPRVVAPDWVLSMCQIELNFVLMLN